MSTIACANLAFLKSLGIARASRTDAAGPMASHYDRYLGGAGRFGPLKHVIHVTSQ